MTERHDTDSGISRDAFGLIVSALEELRAEQTKLKELVYEQRGRNAMVSVVAAALVSAAMLIIGYLLQTK